MAAVSAAAITGASIVCRANSRPAAPPKAKAAETIKCPACGSHSFATMHGQSVCSYCRTPKGGAA